MEKSCDDNAQNAQHSVMTLSAKGTNMHTISVFSVTENVLFTLSHRNVFTHLLHT